MSRRPIFGDSSDAFPDDYPTHPPLVELGHGEHAVYSPDFYQYSGLGGDMAYAEEMPASAQRRLVYNANQDMLE